MKNRQRTTDKYFKNGLLNLMLCVAISICFLCGSFIANLAGDEMFIYSAKGQSAEQQKKDEFECYQWAVQQTGYDPTKSQQAQIDGYNKAKQVCLEGNGYTVK